MGQMCVGWGLANTTGHVLFFGWWPQSLTCFWPLSWVAQECAAVYIHYWKQANATDKICDEEGISFSELIFALTVDITVTAVLPLLFHPCHPSSRLMFPCTLGWNRHWPMTHSAGRKQCMSELSPSQISMSIFVQRNKQCNVPLCKYCPS